MDHDPGLPGRTVIATVAISVFLFLLMGLLLVLSWGAEGLPESIPDLYDPAVISTFHVARHAPFGSCTSTILMSGMAYSQAEGGVREPVVYVLGYLTEPTGRIVAIVQTWIHQSGLRNVKTWYDTGWVDSSPAKGQWDYLGPGISHRMTKAQVKEYLRPLMGKLTHCVAHEGR